MRGEADTADRTDAAKPGSVLSRTFRRPSALTDEEGAVQEAQWHPADSSAAGTILWTGPVLSISLVSLAVSVFVRLNDAAAPAMGVQVMAAA